MSREAWGDEGEVPSKWEDTAMRQEFDALVFKWSEWRRCFAKEVTGEAMEKALDAVREALDEAQEHMVGPL